MIVLAPEDERIDITPPDSGEGDGDGDGEPIRWVTVATYWKPTEVHIARLKLESEEIDCMILDEYVVATDWLYANAVGGIKLQVPEEDLVRARELLIRPTEQAMISADGEPLYDGLERCPRCGSEDIHPQRFSRRMAFLSILLLGAPLPFLRRSVRCAACGYDWKPGGPDPGPTAPKAAAPPDDQNLIPPPA